MMDIVHRSSFIRETLPILHKDKGSGDKDKEKGSDKADKGSDTASAHKDKGSESNAGPATTESSSTTAGESN